MCIYKLLAFEEAPLSEPHLDELAGTLLWYIYLVKVRGHTMSAKWGRKSVILFYASVRGLLTLKRKKYGLYTDGESYHRTVA